MERPTPSQGKKHKTHQGGHGNGGDGVGPAGVRNFMGLKEGARSVVEDDAQKSVW